MPVYEYKAYDAAGAAVSGIIDADTPKDARAKLRRQNVFVTKVEEAGEGVSLTSEVKVSRLWRRVRRQDVVVMTRQLATLVRSGMPLIQALTAISEQLEGYPMQRIVYSVREQVNAGEPLADALEQHPKLFNELYVNLVRAGEAAGVLETVLVRLADYMEAVQKQRSKVLSSMIYPALMVVVGSGVLLFLMTFVVPRLTQIFTEMGQNLPVATQILIAISGFLGSWRFLVLIAVVVALVVIVRFNTRTGRGRLLLDRLRLRVPVAGSLARKIAVSRFARTFGTLLAGGIQVLKALEIVQGVIGNAVISQAISEARERIGEGASISDELRRSQEFPPIVVHMVAVGEASGSLEEMLLNVADTYDNEVEIATNSLIALIEPLMIVLMGLIVGFIVLSILLPIFEMNRFAR
ncbi:MAG: type II secretion system inner membrane protein GspF [Verrucomicrobia bacterium]|nr:type II secretion system inner membrane protein GspF [Verrucomicrobiota bacterium]